jgi:lipid A 4'-phosphatase
LLTRITRNDFFEIASVLTGLLMISGIILAADLDILVQQRFFDQDGEWIFGDAFLWKLLYDHGPKPGLILGIGGLLAFLLSFGVRALRQYRRQALFLALVLVFGAGLAVEALKGVTSRPRPRHIEAFQGDQEFVPVLSIKKPGSGEPVSTKEKVVIMAHRLVENKARFSFPSGHAAIAFYLIAPFFIFRERRRSLAAVFLVGGTGYGLLVGCARMAQGGHFPSDVIWAGGVIYLGCWFFHHLVNAKGTYVQKQEV